MEGDGKATVRVLREVSVRWSCVMSGWLFMRVSLAASFHPLRAAGRHLTTRVERNVMAP